MDNVYYARDECITLTYYVGETWHPDTIIVNCLKNGRHFNQNPYTTSKDVLYVYLYARAPPHIVYENQFTQKRPINF